MGKTDGALLDETAAAVADDVKTEMVPIQLIKVQAQPRTIFDDAKIEELADSMSRHGQLCPIVLEPLKKEENGLKYLLVNGERRLRAAESLRWPDLRAEIRRPQSEVKRLLVQLEDNARREGLSALEEAEAFARLKAKKLSVQEIADQYGASPTHVYNALKLLEASEGVKAALRDGAISPAHADRICRLESQDAQDEALNEVLARELSTRALDEFIAGNWPAKKADAEIERRGDAGKKDRTPADDDDPVGDAQDDMEKDAARKPFEQRAENGSGPKPDSATLAGQKATEDVKLEHTIRRNIAKAVLKRIVQKDFPWEQEFRHHVEDQLIEFSRYYQAECAEVFIALGVTPSNGIWNFVKNLAPRCLAG